MLKKIAPLLVMTAGICWGMIGLFVRGLNDMGLGSMDIVALRAIVAIILLFMMMFCYNRELLKIHLKDSWCFIGTGIFSVVFFNFCYFKAITMTSLAVAAVLLYTAPAFVMLLSAILFQEKITKIKIVSLVATFLGCVLVTGLIGNTEALSSAGILAGLGAGFGYALYSVFSRYALNKGYHSLTISFYTFVFSLIGAVPLTNWRVMGKTVTCGPKTIGFCLLFGLISTVIPYIVYTLGLQEMENSKASIIASVEPVTAALLGVTVYREILTWQCIAGILLVLGAIVVCNVQAVYKRG